MLTVAIIGAGPSGLAAAKEALACGLNPTLFEKASTIGGVWQPVTGHAWDTMQTNISHHTCTFSDFEWKEGVRDFPTRDEFFEYLTAYADAFQLRPHIRFNTEVQKLMRAPNKWIVETVCDSQVHSHTFDSVIVASGIFAKAHTPQIPGLETFKGTVIHAKDYKNFEPFAGKNVVVIGNAFSGCEICAELADKGIHVVNVLRRPMWILPRYAVRDTQSGVKVPIDLVFYSRAAHARNAGVTDDILNQMKNAWFRGLCVEQQALCPELAVQRGDTDPPFASITTGYLEKIREQRLSIKAGDIVEVKETELVFRDSSRLPAEALVFCTGYRADIPFMDAQMQASMGFAPDDQLQPFLLMSAMFPRDLPALACIGLYRGPFLGVMELQARVACLVLSGNIPPPTAEEIERGVAEEQQIRDARPRPQFPHGGYVGFCEELAAMIGVRPDFDRMKAEDGALYQKLWDGPFTVASYRLTGFGSNPEVAARIIERTYVAALNPLLPSKLE